MDQIPFSYFLVIGGSGFILGVFFTLLFAHFILKSDYEPKKEK